MNLLAFLFLKVLVSKKISLIFTLERSSILAACSTGGGGGGWWVCVLWGKVLQKSSNHNARGAHLTGGKLPRACSENHYIKQVFFRLLVLNDS